METKKPWYIWLSIFAFIFLTSDTMKQIKMLKEYRDSNDFFDHFKLWSRYVGHSIKLWGGYVVFLPVAYFLVINFIIENFLDSNDSWLTLFMWIWVAYMYFIGVYITYRHWVWRQKNIPNLL